MSGCSSGTTGGTPTAAVDNPFSVAADAPVEAVVGEEYGGFGAAAYRKKYAQANLTATVTEQVSDVLLPRFAAGNPPDVVLSSGDKALELGRLVAQNQIGRASCRERV